MTEHHHHQTEHEHSGHQHGPGNRIVERHCDVAVVGGSAAGLAAALQLGRQRRSVIVVDAGEPRNASAAHMHGYLGREGHAPSELTAIGREEVRSYGAEVLDGRVTRITRLDDSRFRVELVGGHSLVARRVLAATGLVDELPDIPGITEHWGHGVIHCPFCHGYEVRDRRIVQIVSHPMALHPAAVWAHLAGHLTVVIHGDVDVDAAQIEALRAGGVDVLAGQVTGVTSGSDGEVEGIELAGHGPVPADVIAVGPRFRVRAEPFAQLGLEPTTHPTGAGDHLEADAMGQTAVRGVYAAGNVKDPSHQVLHAAADGSRVGAMIAFDLAHEDLGSDRRSANQLDWDHRYGDQPMWSGNPNGSLVAELAELSPGRALDVGAGEGADAIWLAEQGWKVTAADISAPALDRMAAEAGRRGLDIESAIVDANDPDAFEPAGFDVVTAMYASIPRTADRRGVDNLLKAVAPGGTLLVVSHDLAPMRQPVDTTTESRAFDPDAYVRVEDFVAAVTGNQGWEIEVHETRTRPKGSATDAHHVDDVVLRVGRLD
jgi:thioredoxin reductase/SAM-dependent methyltransferase